MWLFSPIIIRELCGEFTCFWCWSHLSPHFGDRDGTNLSRGGSDHLLSLVNSMVTARYQCHSPPPGPYDAQGADSGGALQFKEMCLAGLEFCSRWNFRLLSPSDSWWLWGLAIKLQRLMNITFCVYWESASQKMWALGGRMGTSQQAWTKRELLVWISGQFLTSLVKLVYTF